MIIISKLKLIGILVISFFLIIAAAVWAYSIGMQCQLKSSSELLLFLGFIGAGLQAVLSVSLLLSARKTHNDFLMLMKAITLNGVLSESRAKKLGNLGFALQEALEAAHHITAQKSLKIAGLNGLIEVVISMLDQAVVVVNLVGEILLLSPKAQNATGYKKGDMLAQLLPELSVKEAFIEALTTRLPVRHEQAVFIPVFSATGDSAYFLVQLSQSESVSKVMDGFARLIKKDDPKKQRKPPLFKLFKPKNSRPES